MINEHEFIEHVKNFGNRYGTPLSFVKEKLGAGKDLILEIDVQGAEKIRQKFPDCILIFVIPPSLAVLRARIEARGTESEEHIAIRLGQALKEVECVREYDYCIVNDELEIAVQEMMGIISAQHNKVGDRADQIIKIFKEA